MVCPSVNSFKFQTCDRTPPRTRKLEVSRNVEKSRGRGGLFFFFPSFSITTTIIIIITFPLLPSVARLPLASPSFTPSFFLPLQHTFPFNHQVKSSHSLTRSLTVSSPLRLSLVIPTIPLFVPVFFVLVLLSPCGGRKEGRK
jgi:hypothetical protein